MPLAFYCGHAKLGKGKSGGQKGRGRRSREQSARIIELSAGAAAAGWGWNKTKVVKIMIALAPEQRLSFALSPAFPCFPRSPMGGRLAYCAGPMNANAGEVSPRKKEFGPSGQSSQVSFYLVNFVYFL